MLKGQPSYRKRVDGLQTGHTDAAGYCLAASSNRDGMRLISVIMGTESQQARADQSRELLNWGFGHFTTQMPRLSRFGSRRQSWSGVIIFIQVQSMKKTP